METVGIRANNLPNFHPDPADRIIVATALEGHRLLTADELILNWSGSLDRPDAKAGITAGANVKAPSIDGGCCFHIFRLRRNQGSLTSQLLERRKRGLRPRDSASSSSSTHLAARRCRVSVFLAWVM